MKYHVEIAGTRHEVEILAPGQVTVNGRELSLDVVPGHLLHEGRSLRFHISRDAQGIPIRILLDGQPFEVAVDDGRRLGRARGSRAAPASDGQVTAPMNGQVVKIIHREGDDVEKGDVVLVLEAMKMENEVAAPVSGRLQAVQVAQGATVKPGDALFRIAPATNA